MTVEHRAEVCVVGAGPAGAIVAERLAAAGRRVVVIEHGPALDGLDARRRSISPLAVSPVEAQIDPVYRQDVVAPPPASPQGGAPYAYYRVSAVGGSSLHWAGFTPRPVEADLARWPIGWAELEPWLGRAERAIGVAGGDDNPYASPRSTPPAMPRHPPTRLEERFVTPAAARLGWRVHAQPVAITSRAYDGRPACARCGTCSVCPTGARYSADLVHVPRLIAHGATVIDGLHARRLELDQAGRRVVALHAAPTDAEGEAHLVRADEYVVAAGGVETPRLLLLSRDHPRHPDGLGNAGGRLGAGFRDHAFTVTQLVVDDDVGWGVPSHACATDHHRVGAARAERGAFHLVFVRDPLMDDLVRRSTRRGELDVDALRATARGAFLVLGTAELEGGGAVRLDPERTDRHGDPLPRVTVPVGERDRGTLGAMRGAVDAFAAAVGAVDHGGAGEGFAWGSHPMGACAMAADPEGGVVDADARVFGVENLSLAGSAIFPSLGSANPTLTLAALSLRLAHRLGGEVPS